MTCQDDINTYWQAKATGNPAAIAAAEAQLIRDMHGFGQLYGRDPSGAIGYYYLNCKEDGILYESLNDARGLASQ